MEEQRLTIQAYVDDEWHDAATVRFIEPGRGITGKTIVQYDDPYYFDLAVVDALDGAVVDRRALSVRLPVDLETSDLPTWPAWLLDLMPQGNARQRIAQRVGLRADDPSVELHLLLEAGGSPIGNLRVKEAWEAEQVRLADVECPPLTDDDIRTSSEAFLDVVDRFAHLASGSSGVQGEWPKALMTRRAADGHWYPDPFVPTEEGSEHAIVKLLQSQRHDDQLIISSEAAYLDVANAFGLNVAAPLNYQNGVLFIPRFDRAVNDGRVLLHGQESLTSALGKAAFSYATTHEAYLQVIREFSDDPAADSLEYVLRDVLNAAMGNPDNHGRNTALAKNAYGGIRLAPLFDFAPMRLSPANIIRSTRWECLGGKEMAGHWGAVCAAAACDGLSAEDIKDALVSRIPFLRKLPRIAAKAGVMPEVIERACHRHHMVADAIEELA